MGFLAASCSHGLYLKPRMQKTVSVSAETLRLHGATSVPVALGSPVVVWSSVSKPHVSECCRSNGSSMPMSREYSALLSSGCMRKRVSGDEKSAGDSSKI